PTRPSTFTLSLHDALPISVRVERTAYGRALVDAGGFALYLFTHDRSAHSTCYGACAAAWPPYVVAKRPSNAASGAAGRLVGGVRDRKSTRLNSSHVAISYA